MSTQPYGQINNNVFDVLVKTGRPMSIEAVVHRLPKYTRGQVRDALANLCQAGSISRVKRGVYHYRTDTNTVEDAKLEEDYYAPEPVPALADVVKEDWVVKDQLLPSSVHSDVEDIKEMYLPAMVHQRHIQAIANWEQITTELFIMLRSDV